jgi:hypothetical protein
VFEAYAAHDSAVTTPEGAIAEPYTEWVLREYVRSEYTHEGTYEAMMLAEAPDDPAPEETEEPLLV